MSDWIDEIPITAITEGGGVVPIGEVKRHKSGLVRIRFFGSDALDVDWDDVGGLIWALDVIMRREK